LVFAEASLAHQAVVHRLIMPDEAIPNAGYGRFGWHVGVAVALALGWWRVRSSKGGA
jgi:hypothetical protein